MNIVSFENAAELIASGAVGIIPTDTVYGLVTSAHNPESVERFYALKDRDKKPGTLIASKTADLLMIGADVIEVNKVATLWPNPVSIVISVNGHDYLHQGVGTLAIRITADPTLKTLLDAIGPIITSSANQPGMPIATTIEEASTYFGDNVDFYVDGGVITNIPASTILRPTNHGMEILRQGSFTL